MANHKTPDRPIGYDFASSNKCLTSSNKKLPVTSASLLVTSALLVYNKCIATRNRKLLRTCVNRGLAPKKHPQHQVWRAAGEQLVGHGSARAGDGWVHRMHELVAAVSEGQWKQVLCRDELWHSCRTNPRKDRHCTSCWLKAPNLFKHVWTFGFERFFWDS